MDVLKELITTTIVAFAKQHLNDVKHWAEDYEEDIKLGASNMANNIIENFMGDIKTAGNIVAEDIRYAMEHEE